MKLCCCLRGGTAIVVGTELIGWFRTVSTGVRATGCCLQVPGDSAARLPQRLRRGLLPAPGCRGLHSVRRGSALSRAVQQEAQLCR